MGALFANNASTTVTSGGTTAPAGGTVETWTVASSAAFPAAAAGAGTYFMASDPALPSEVVQVTDVSGTSWTVTRGAENTTPLAHAVGFTIIQVASAGNLGGFVQGALNTSASVIQADGNQAAGATGDAADAGHVHPAGSWMPADNNLLAAAAAVDSGGSSSTAAAGVLYLEKIPIRYPLTATYVWVVVVNAGSGASTGSYLGLYNSSGALLSGTADIGSSLTSAGPVQAALTTPQALTGGTFVWAAILVNLASSQPGLRTYGASSQLLVNLGLTAASYRAASNGTALASLPASFTPSANSGASSFWAAIS